MKYRIIKKKEPFHKEIFIPQYKTFLWFWCDMLRDYEFINSAYGGFRDTCCPSLDSAQMVIDQYKKYLKEKNNRYEEIVEEQEN